MSDKPMQATARVWIEDESTMGGEMILPGLGHLTRDFYIKVLGMSAAARVRHRGSAMPVGEGKRDLRLDGGVARTGNAMVDVGAMLDELNRLRGIVEKLA